MTTEQQLRSLTSQSSRDGEGSSSLKRISKESQSIIVKKSLTGLTANVREIIRNHKPQTAFDGGGMGVRKFENTF